MVKLDGSFLLSSDGRISDKSLFEKSQKFLNELKRKVKEISKEADDSTIKEVAGFILENAHVRCLEQQEAGVLLFKDFPFKKNGLPVAFLIGNLKSFTAAINGLGIHAFYHRSEDKEDLISNFIGLQDPRKSTLLFQAVNFFHEAKHALDHKTIPDYSQLSDQEREDPARFLEDIIISAYGGKELIKLAKEYAKKIERKVNDPTCDERKAVSTIASQYERKLDHIFGKSASKDEELFRMGRFVYDFAYRIYLVST